MEINIKKLEDHIISGAKAVMSGWDSEKCCIGMVGKNIQIQLIVTGDEDDFIKPVKKHFCVKP